MGSVDLRVPPVSASRNLNPGALSIFLRFFVLKDFQKLVKIIFNSYLGIYGSKNDEINFGVFYKSRSTVWCDCMSWLDNFSVQMYFIHVFADN